MASTTLIFLLFTTTVLFALPITTSYPTDNICKQTKDPNFCSGVLGRGLSATLSELEQIAIDQTISNVKSTSDKIKSLTSQTNDPNLKVVYSLCSNYYSAALSALIAANEKLKSGQFGDLNAAASTVSKDADSCEQAYSLAPPLEKIPIAGDNKNFGLLAEIFSVVSRILSTS